MKTTFVFMWLILKPILHCAVMGIAFIPFILFRTICFIPSAFPWLYNLFEYNSTDWIWIDDMVLEILQKKWSTAIDITTEKSSASDKESLLRGSERS